MNDQTAKLILEQLIATYGSKAYCGACDRPLIRHSKPCDPVRGQTVQQSQEQAARWLASRLADLQRQMKEGVRLQSYEEWELFFAGLVVRKRRERMNPVEPYRGIPDDAPADLTPKIHCMICKSMWEQCKCICDLPACVANGLCLCEGEQAFAIEDRRVAYEKEKAKKDADAWLKKPAGASRWSL